ncbi:MULTISPECIES: NRDE family protein [unclassified Algibacter]|uniref:NRDE family protein n=1 Tax=unclassified Algibacter TaxID=2615009 RepID=UPI00131B28FE|nr:MULTISPECIES: NRDE family protein [unclassified Algibacter]MCL5128652.1 NRDE family protein [Algibacter sp. L4_22]
MCTVTIFPTTDNGFVLTSNRDEAPNRISLEPNLYNIENTNLLFPKDKLAGGTWIGVSEKNRLICVLNGGFKNHQKQDKYRLSRGVIAKDFLITDNIEACIENYNLEDIEPFTIVISDWNSQLKFYELVWDGSNKHFTKLPLEPKIWSSSTLYNADMKTERLQWFENYKQENKLTAKSILKFHKTAGADNDNFGVIMNRGSIKTTSITQVEKINNSVNMRYESLHNQSISNKTLKTPQIVNG